MKRRKDARLAPTIACRLARAVVEGEESSADAYRAILRRKGFDPHVISPDEIAGAVKRWTEIAARSRIAGLKPVLIVPLATQADPLIFEPASNLVGPIDEAPHESTTRTGEASHES